MKLSVVIPAYNEALNLPDTLIAVYEKLKASGIDHELLVVNDNSSDNTVEILEVMTTDIHTCVGQQLSAIEWLWLCCSKGA
jgi:dolichol-phosphate mannosyltransferase